MMEFDLEFHF